MSIYKSFKSDLPHKFSKPKYSPQKVQMKKDKKEVTEIFIKMWRKKICGKQ